MYLTMHIPPRSEWLAPKFGSGYPMLSECRPSHSKLGSHCCIGMLVLTSHPISRTPKMEPPQLAISVAERASRITRFSKKGRKVSAFG